MNLVKNYALNLSLFALAVGLTASQANAQSPKGTFNLPFQAYWGNAVLEPGKYTISLPTEASNSPIMYLSGQGRTIMVLLGMSGRTESDRSYLRVENIGQAHVVRELTYGPTGRLIRFLVPKSVRNQASFESSAQETRLAVAPFGGN
ncbi:MAG: hypothetical protein ACR2JB_20465 [Bryobacteraceae bacterium]